MGLFGIDITHMTATLSSIIIGVGVDFSIHYTSEYKNLIDNKISDVSGLIFPDSLQKLFLNENNIDISGLNLPENLKQL